VKQVVFVADFFKEEVTGGAEINDDALISFLASKNLLYTKIKSERLSEVYILDNIDKYYIISNFAFLPTVVKATLYKHGVYSIYEHDYKFLKNRNPITYPDFVAPDSQLTNINFYKKAHRVICLSQMQKEIYEKNLDLDNLENIRTSLFSEELIEFLLSLSKKKKEKKYAVIKSSNPIKKTHAAVNFCRKNGYEYDLISHENNAKFLEILSEYENLVFMTGHPEPTPRVAIECKIMGVNIIAPRRLIGIASESWFAATGPEFVLGLRDARQKAENMFQRLLGEI
tara:strand:- start:4470 stop:5321 length:852 start_codon:yes stop_codon:yes gene_type:complete